MKGFVAAVVWIGASALPAMAIAQDDAPAPTPPRRASLGVNPLAFLLGRFGGDAEYLAAPHVALVANLHVDVSAAFTNTATNPYWGFGGEAGIRLYSSPDSVFGFFMGPSFVAGWYAVTYYAHGLSVPDYGFAVDLGGKARVGDRGFVTLGAGMQHLSTPSYPRDVDGIVTFVLGPGWAPRLLLTAGTSFR